MREPGNARTSTTRATPASRRTAISSAIVRPWYPMVKSVAGTGERRGAAATGEGGPRRSSHLRCSARGRFSGDVFGAFEIPGAAHHLEVAFEPELRERRLARAHEPEVRRLLGADDDRVRVAGEHGGGKEVD